MGHLLGRKNLEFLETGKELQVKGFEAYVAGVGESEQEEAETYFNKDEGIHENGDNTNGEINICDTIEPSTEKHYVVDANLQQRNEKMKKIQVNSNDDLDLQIKQLIEKSDGAWKCKVCERTSTNSGHMREHVETHIEGISHACHICSKNFPNRNSLRGHIYKIHSDLLSCDLCGKTGMNKMSYYDHKKRHHK